MFTFFVIITQRRCQNTNGVTNLETHRIAAAVVVIVPNITKANKPVSSHAAVMHTPVDS
jgi:hypothetical protein